MAAGKKARRKSAEQKFTDDLVLRGEAVPKKSSGQKIPPGATHWLVEDEKTGARKVKRARFKLL